MLYIVDIEGVETRYTQQWKEHIPKILKNAGIEATVIEGSTDIPDATTPGAFLNFGGTNVYKSTQLEKIARMFCNGEITNGDYFLYTDAWNPTVIQLKYMAELLGLRIRIGGMWHAGSYDPHDFLGRIIGDEKWVRNAERAMFDCYDDNFFATNFHIDMFTRELFGIPYRQMNKSNKINQIGWPMEYLNDELYPYSDVEKEDIILFPHRVAPEKQPEIFDLLKEAMPEYTFIKCQDMNLTKDEYHKLLAKAKIVFSANLQETLGISVYEGVILDTIPVMPDRLSYAEMWSYDFLYPSEWTENLKSAERYLPELKSFITNTMLEYDGFKTMLDKEFSKVSNFYSSKNLVDHLRKFVV